MTWKDTDPQGNEAAKIRHLIVPYTRGHGLDIGCGPFKAWPHFTGYDNLDEYQLYPDHWMPDVVGDCLDLGRFADRSHDFVFSSHVLEHVVDTEKALREWWRVLKVGGYLVLYLPHAELYPRMGEPGANLDHKHDFMPDDIVALMRKVGSWTLLVDQTRAQDREYSFFQVYQKISGTRDGGLMITTQNITPPITQKRCLVVRYGGFGDMIQAASILPALKAEGYHVTFNTTVAGQDIVKHDPNVDAWIIQDRDQVPNVLLGDYWAALEKEYDRYVNLSESVEGTLLAMPGRRTHAMPKEARHTLMNHNYLEFTHQLAGVPFEPNARFYPTADENSRMKTFVEKMDASPVLLWSMSGSSIHKVYPWADMVIGAVLQRFPNAKIITCGDRESQILEAGTAQYLLSVFCALSLAETSSMKLSEMLTRLKDHWGKNRLICMSGAMPIRDTMALCAHVDMIVGPETGVLNAAGMLDTHKVCLLSHSTAKNLTQHWKNCTPIIPIGVECYPCHRLHYGSEFCPVDETTQGAMCAASIVPDRVFQAIEQALLKQEEIAA